MKKRNKGITLIEMMIVVSVIGLLLVMLLPSIKGYKENVDKVKLEAGFKKTYEGARSVMIKQGERFTWLEVVKDDTPKELGKYNRGFTFNEIRTNPIQYYLDAPSNPGNSFSGYNTKHHNFLWDFRELMPKGMYINIKVYELGVGIPSFKNTRLSNCFGGENFGTGYNYPELSLCRTGGGSDEYTPNTYTRHDGEVIWFGFPNADDDPDTYSIIFVPDTNKYNPIKWSEYQQVSVDYEYNGHEWTEDSSFYTAPEYSTQNMDIIVFNQGYYSINGGELIEAEPTKAYRQFEF